jgi:2-dehydropantoate 2-reductase
MDNKSAKKEDVRILVYGAGAVGGYIGAHLIENGLNVTFIARGPHLNKIVEQGLQINLGDGIRSVFPDFATDSLSHFNNVKFNVVIIAVKAWQVKEAAKEILSFTSLETLVISVQNGINCPYELNDVFAPNQIVPSVFRGICLVSEPGIIFVPSQCTWTLGEFEKDSISDISEKLHLFIESKLRLNVSIVDDIILDLWKKIALIAPMSGVGAVTRSVIGVSLEISELKQMLINAMEEIVEVAFSQKIVLPDDTVKNCIGFYQSLPYSATSSMQRDIELKKPSELEYQNGVIVKLAMSNKISAPVNSFIYYSLLPQELAARSANL